MGTILSALNVKTNTSSAIKQALKRSMPNQWARSYQRLMSTLTQAQLICLNEDQITSITVIKVENQPTNGI